MMRYRRPLQGTLLLGVALLAGCERPPIKVTQEGFRGNAREQNSNPRLAAHTLAANQPPAVIPAAAPDVPMAAGTYQNVQVLGDLSVGEFNRTMVAMGQWVAPKQQCAYCHNLANLASDEKYTKVVARRMLQMTREINTNWTGHVAQTGVTCYTCHRGNAVPNGVWYYTDQNQVLRYMLDREDVRVQSRAALPADAHNRSSIKQTEGTYSLMLHISKALGVNCVFCHNSRQWSSWEESAPQRLIALRGLRMARALNTSYLGSLNTVWPSGSHHDWAQLDQYGTLVGPAQQDTARLGPSGDAPKLQCVTCHNGVNKPLYGAPMAKDYPGLMGPQSAAPGYVAPAASAAPTNAADGTTAMASASTGMGAGVMPAPGSSTTAELQNGPGAMGGHGNSGKSPDTLRVSRP